MGTAHADAARWAAAGLQLSVCMACRTANWLLRKHPEARRRNLQLYAPIIVSLWPQARMVQEEPSCMTLADVYDLHCESAGREPERIITYFKENVHKYMEKDPQGTALASAVQVCEGSGSAAACELCTSECLWMGVNPADSGAHAPSRD